MTIKLGTLQGNFAVTCEFEERKIPKKAGFDWSDEHNCWLTNDVFIAYKLKEYTFTDRLRKIFKTIEDNLAQSSATTPKMAIKYQEAAASRYKFSEYQKAAAEWILERKVTYLADEPGVGKTASAILAHKIMKPLKTIVICPSTLKYNWEAEFQMWNPVMTEKPVIQIIENKKDYIDTAANIYIISYDMCHEMGIISQIRNCFFDYIICDEAHYLKSGDAKRTKAVLNPDGLFENYGKMVLMSGTPMVNRPIELFAVLKALSPITIGDMNWLEYCYKYCAAKHINFGNKRIFDYHGSSNMEELNLRLRGSVMITRTKAQVLHDLPEKQYIPLVLSDKITDKFNFSKFKSSLKLLANELKVDYKNSEQDDIEIGDDDTHFSTLRREVGFYKAQICVPAIVELLETHDKIVVFAHHQEVVQYLEQHLQKFKPVCIHGGTPRGKARDKIVHKFQNDPNHRVFIGNIKAAGVGVTLTAASTVFFVEMSYSPGEIEQAVDRCHRRGQKNAVIGYIPMVKNSAEMNIVSALIEKLESLSHLKKTFNRIDDMEF